MTNQELGVRHTLPAHTATAELARIGLDDELIMAITGHREHRMVQLYAGAERSNFQARAANVARETKN